MSSRYDNNRRRGTKNRELGQQSPGDMRWQDYMSHQAELWVCRYFGADETIANSNRPDRGFDLIIPGTDIRADVKWSSTYPGKWYGASPGYPTLNLATWKQGGHRADVYIGTFAEMVEDFDRYGWSFGWARLRELLDAPTVQGKYGKPYHALGFDYLHPLEDLRHAVTTYDDVPDLIG